jgi:hypothetical protein
MAKMTIRSGCNVEEQYNALYVTAEAACPRLEFYQAGALGNK